MQTLKNLIFSISERKFVITRVDLIREYEFSYIHLFFTCTYLSNNNVSNLLF